MQELVPNELLADRDQAILLTLDEKQLLFMFRTRTYDCKGNLKSNYGSDLVYFFCLEEDLQQHLLHCKITDDVNTENVKYEDLLLDKQVKIVKIWMKIVAREVF